MKRISILQPNDMHLHLRDGKAMAAVLPFSARQMGAAVIMPNLKSPVVQVADALAYQQRILANLPVGSSFQPLMTLYLTDHTTPKLVQAAKAAGIVAFKLYPAGVTTHAEQGVTALFKLEKTLEAMIEVDMPLLIHGEVVDTHVDIFDREALFVEQILHPLLQLLPKLKVVFEHISTQEAAQFVLDAGENVAATVTPQHLLYNRNDLLFGGIRPHYYCLPILKREQHRLALIKAVTGEQAHKFFLGTDSAPHAKSSKESACGCAGVFSAHAAIEFYAEAFEQANALDKLEAFASINGAKFYALAQNKARITLVKQPQSIVAKIKFGDDYLIPLRGKEQIPWRIL